MLEKEKSKDVLKRTCLKYIEQRMKGGRKMNKKRIFFYGVIVILIFVLGGGLYLWKTKSEEKLQEYIPEPEITEEQERMTIVSLYYLDSEAQTLKTEDRLIDVKSLVNTPYETLFNLLKEKPHAENLISAIPEGTMFHKAEVKNGILYLDLSKEFIENHPGGKNEELQSVYSIVNTFTELVEVNGVKILINGEENLKFSDGLINFSEIFLKI